MSSAERSLLVRARDGDRAALVELFRRHEPRVRSAIQARLPQRWQALLSADDVLQHTYLEALLDIDRFWPRQEAAFCAWIQKLAEHHLIEALRALQAEKRGGKMRRVGLPDGVDSCTALVERLTGAITSTTPSAGIRGAEQRACLERALGRLPEHYQLVVRRYDLERRPIDDIAAELRRSPGAVHLIRVRAHARLRELLSGHSTIFS